MYAVELAKFLTESANELLGSAEFATEGCDARIEEAAELLHLGSRILNRASKLRTHIEPVIQEAA